MARTRAPDTEAPKAHSPARRHWWLVVLGIAAALAFVVATLPAMLLSRPLQRLGLEAASLAGSVWSGHARALAWRSVPIGDVHWSLAPLSLLSGRIGANFSLALAEGSLDGRFNASPGGEIRLEDVRFDLPLAAVAAMPVGLPRGWRGRISGQLEEIVVNSGWPTSLRGTLEMDELVAPPPRSVSIGSYHIVIPDPEGDGSAADGTLDARVTDKEGPFSFNGRFTLGADRSFLLDGTLAPRGNTPPALRRTLELLGPADADGRRPVSVSGTL